MNSRLIINQIRALPQSFSYTDGPDFCTLNLDQPVRIFAWSSFFRRQLSLREYLIKLAEAKSPKVVDLVTQLDAMSHAETTHDADLARVKFLEKLSEQRYARKMPRTTGETIFQQACKRVKLFIDRVVHTTFGRATFKKTHTPTTQIHDNNKLFCTRLFKDIPPNKHRIGVFTQCDLNIPVTLQGPDDISSENLPTPDVIRQKNLNALPVPTHRIRGEVNTWIPLTTLTSNDYIHPSEITADFEFELGYSRKAAQYYIKPLTQQDNDEYDIAYQLYSSTPDEIVYREDQQFNPREIKCLKALSEFQFGDKKKIATLKLLFQPLTIERSLILLQHFFNKFKDENLDQHFPEFTVKAMNAMMLEQKGVCDQRALLCREIAETLGMQARHVINQIHAFCEIDDRTVDLGGGHRDIHELDLSKVFTIEVSQVGAISAVALNIETMSYQHQKMLPDKLVNINMMRGMFGQ